MNSPQPCRVVIVVWECKVYGDMGTKVMATKVLRTLMPSNARNQKQIAAARSSDMRRTRTMHPFSA
jgi:G:T-mismatch repair DNA endonuclease (very short patch repair protein)